MGRIVITGGAGAIATRVRPLLRRVGHELVLVDLVDPADADAGETVVVADITDEKAMTSAFEGSDCVVHLGGFPKERPWEDIARVNIDGTQVVLNACKAAGVRRVLIASSLHAVGALTAQEVSVTAEPVAAPDSYYGVGKVASEALAKLYGTRFDMAVVAARLGTAEPIPGSPRTLSTWLSTGDMARLIEATAALDQPGFHLVWGMSANTRGWVDLQAGRLIGYHPVDDAEAYAGRLGYPDPLPLSTRLDGGRLNVDLGGSW